MRAFEKAVNIHRTCHFWSLFASCTVPGPNLPESVINEAEAAWSKVVATVNNVHPDSLQSQFYPLFAERVTEPLMIEGKNVFNSFRSLIAFCPGRIVTILS